MRLRAGVGWGVGGMRGGNLQVNLFFNLGLWVTALVFQVQET